MFFAKPGAFTFAYLDKIGLRKIYFVIYPLNITALA